MIPIYTLIIRLQNFLSYFFANTCDCQCWFFCVVFFFQLFLWLCSGYLFWLYLHFLIINAVINIMFINQPLWIFLLWSAYSNTLLIFGIAVCFSYWSVNIFLYSQCMWALYHVHVLHIYDLTVCGLLFTLFMVSFDKERLLVLMYSILSIFSFMVSAFSAF